MDDQLALRLGALRLARRRGRLREAAWAAARLRLTGVRLAGSEARFARDMRIRFGRSLRSARVRMSRPLRPDVAIPLRVEEPRVVDRRGLVAAAIALLYAGPNLALAALLAAAAGVGGIAALAARYLGGYTGDVLGAAEQTAEALVLIVAAGSR